MFAFINWFDKRQFSRPYFESTCKLKGEKIRFFPCSCFFLFLGEKSPGFPSVDQVIASVVSFIVLAFLLQDFDPWRIWRSGNVCCTGTHEKLDNNDHLWSPKHSPCHNEVTFDLKNAHRLDAHLVSGKHLIFDLSTVNSDV